MPVDLDKFRGRLPYASELFGIYQPLMGWKSKIIQRRLEDSPLTLGGFPRIFTVKEGARIQVHQGSERILIIDGDGDVSPDKHPDVFREDAVPILLDPPEYLDSLILRFMQPELEQWLRKYPVEDKASWAKIWQSLLTKERLNEILGKAIDQIGGEGRALFEPKLPDPADRLADYVARTRTLFAYSGRGRRLHFQQRSPRGTVPERAFTGARRRCGGRRFPGQCERPSFADPPRDGLRKSAETAGPDDVH
jgi:hypothetical protein